MRKLIAIGLIAAIVLSSTEAYQLLKIPFLVKHFINHQQENPQLSFLGFLDMHYLHGSPRDKDYSDDMKLPFKTASGNSVTSFAPVIIPPQLSVEAVYWPEQRPARISIHWDSYLPSPHLSAIWQPPRAC